jgi:hypothetical protein
MTSSDYYRELSGHPDRARAVGWESLEAQQARFDVVARHCRVHDRVLDLGAGLGDLGRYLHGRVEVRYLGLERDPGLISRGRALEPSVSLEAFDIFSDAPLPSAEVVVAIGCLVDGESLKSDALRFGKLRRLISRATSAATRTTIIIALDQDALERHPIRAMEPALGGLRRAEVAWLAPSATLLPLLGTDLALIIPIENRES